MSIRSWEEALHPRDHGRFSSKPGTSGHMPAVNVSRAHTNGVANAARAKADGPAPHSKLFDMQHKAKEALAANNPSRQLGYRASQTVSELARKYGGTAIVGHEVKPGDRVIVHRDLRGNHEEKTVKSTGPHEIRFTDGSLTTIHGNVVRLDRRAEVPR